MMLADKTTRHEAPKIFDYNDKKHLMKYLSAEIAFPCSFVPWQQTERVIMALHLQAQRIKLFHVFDMYIQT